jgi:hypothetical protein
VRKILVTVVAVLVSAATGALAPAAAADKPSCGVTWGSTAKAAGDLGAAHLSGVRAGRHACYDRLVLDLDGDASGYRVAYVNQVREDGSGNVVRLRGGARLQVVALSPAYDDDGDETYAPANRRELVSVHGWRTFRQVAWAGSFEGQTTLGLGVRARLPFRAFTLDGPGGGSRIVVDVAHLW